MASQRRGHIRLNELRSCLNLVAECGELGCDARSWRLRLLEGLRDLLGAQVGISSEMEGFGRDPKPRVLASVRTGWASAAAETAWREYLDQVPLERTPEFGPLTKAPGPVVTRSREQIWESGAWYRSRTFNDFHRASGVDHYVISLHQVPSRRTTSSIWLHRAVGGKPFDRIERAMIQIIHQHLVPMIGTALASATDPSPASLSPRRREVLARLLEGDSEKQIATSLHVSPATVHEHVGAIYRHFGVISRPELMARFVRRQR